MSKGVMGFSISKCPCCSIGQVEELGSSVVCNNCGPIVKQVFLEKLLDLTPTYAFKLVNDGMFGTPPQSSITSVKTVQGESVVVNGITDGSPFYKHPSLWPDVKANQDIVLIDDPNELKNFPPNAMAYTGDWLNKWNRYWNNKIVRVMYSEREAFARSIAMGMVDSGVKVYFGKYEKGKVYDENDLKGMVSFSSSPSVNINKEQNKQQLESMSLKDVIGRYHHAIMHGRPVYRQNLARPIHEVAEDVMNWFLERGARRIWNVEDDTGHMIYDGKLYTLKPNDSLFKSLLWKEGGISSATTEGRAIIDCLCSMVLDSEKVFPESFLQSDVINNTINIKQGQTSIKISTNEVMIENNTKLTYDLLRGDRRWFQPINLVDGDGLSLLRTAFVDYFAVSPTAREIILCWLLAIFLQDFSSIRPGVHITGPASTGKSTILLLSYWLFYGKNTMSLPGGMTKAGLWRMATVEPFLPIDNKNLSGMSESWQEFLDMCATGGERGIGASDGSARNMLSQHAHSIVMLSGLDHCIHQDVRTRYFEIQTDYKYKTGFYAINNKKAILDNRDLIMSSVFRMFSQDVLPKLNTYANEEMARQYRILLTDKKERTVDYFLLMLAIGEALQKHNVLDEGNLGERWCKYLRQEAMVADRINAISIEWWKNFKIAVITKADELSIFREGKMTSNGSFNFIESEGKRTGIYGTKEEILNALSWAASALKRRLPWNNVREMMHDHITDASAWTDIGWSYETTDDTLIVKWGEGI